MTITIHKMDEVWTADDFKLGMAHCLYYRPEDQVRPGELLYAAYLEVVNYQLGDDYFVPLDFIERVDGADSRLKLTVPLKTVMNRTWSRRPEFVARKLGRRAVLTYPDNTEAKQPVA
ncbi:MAG TPA: hypothetical protein VK879_09985 [Candidatus Sulfomarinibacteraceae bacterium]|nr:hypothetical protein [Candidatus Sulfomarinibacteraceae bacterium]